MKKTKHIYESTIKIALEKGLITKKEAYQMLRVYLQKSTFTNTTPRPDAPLY